MAPQGRAILTGPFFGDVSADAIVDCQIARALGAGGGLPSSGGRDITIPINTAQNVLTLRRTPERREVWAIYAQTILTSASTADQSNNVQVNIAVSPAQAGSYGLASQQTINYQRGAARSVNLDGRFYLQPDIEYTAHLSVHCYGAGPAVVVTANPGWTYMFGHVAGWW